MRLLTHHVDELVTVSLLVVVIVAIKNLAVDSEILINEKNGEDGRTGGAGAGNITSYARWLVDAVPSTRQERTTPRVLVCAFV